MLFCQDSGSGALGFPSELVEELKDHTPPGSSKSLGTVHDVEILHDFMT